MLSDERLREMLARAMCIAAMRDPDMCIDGMGVVGESGATFECHRRAWEDYAALAKVAIEAMRAHDPETLSLREANAKMAEALEKWSDIQKRVRCGDWVDTNTTASAVRATDAALALHRGDAK